MCNGLPFFWQLTFKGISYKLNTQYFTTYLGLISGFIFDIFYFGGGGGVICDLDKSFKRRFFLQCGMLGMWYAGDKIKVVVF